MIEHKTKHFLGRFAVSTTKRERQERLLRDWYGIHWNKWGKVFKNGPNKTCGRQPLKNLKWYGLLREIPSFQHSGWIIPWKWLRKNLQVKSNFQFFLLHFCLFYILLFRKRLHSFRKMRSAKRKFELYNIKNTSGKLHLHEFMNMNYPYQSRLHLFSFILFLKSKRKQAIFNAFVTWISCRFWLVFLLSLLIFLTVFDWPNVTAFWFKANKKLKIVMSPKAPPKASTE